MPAHPHGQLGLQLRRPGVFTRPIGRARFQRSPACLYKLNEIGFACLKCGIG